MSNIIYVNFIHINIIYNLFLISNLSCIDFHCKCITANAIFTLKTEQMSQNIFLFLMGGM